ncbi:MAG: permease-like cell division protein FtsX [Clostridiales bacterium]|nr:permease-like cell division protein FtsX [Clostridiales bacterium]
MNLWPWIYLWRDARQGIARHPLNGLAVVIIVAFAAVVAGATGLLLAASSSAAALLERQAEIRVFLVPDADSQEAARAAAAIPGVKGVDVISREETLSLMEKAFAARVSLRQVFADNPFFDSLRVQVEGPSEVPEVVKALEKLPGVDEVVDAQAYVEPLLRLSQFLRRAGILAAGAVSLIAALVVAVTWQVALQSRLPEIRAKSLLGTPPSRQLAQALLEGGLLGLLGGLLAAWVQVFYLSALARGLAEAVPFFQLVPPYGRFTALILLASVLLGGLSAMAAAYRVLREVD